MGQGYEGEVCPRHLTTGCIWGKERSLSTSVAQEIELRLSERFRPERLEVINESHLHAGHGGHHGGAPFDGRGETHFRVRIVAAQFSAMSRVERHRAINDALADLLAGGVHALALEPAAPGEPVRW